MIKIELAYAKSDKQILMGLLVEDGTCIEEAIKASGIRERFPELNEAPLKIGIFSKLVSLEYILKENDRIEIYRPLIIDPKIARLQKVKQKRREKLKNINERK